MHRYEIFLIIQNIMTGLSANTDNRSDVYVSRNFNKIVTLKSLLWSSFNENSVIRVSKKQSENLVPILHDIKGKWPIKPIFDYQQIITSLKQKGLCFITNYSTLTYPNTHSILSSKAISTLSEGESNSNF